jgi:hypothetical protein
MSENQMDLKIKNNKLVSKDNPNDIGTDSDDDPLFDIFTVE